MNAPAAKDLDSLRHTELTKLLTQWQLDEEFISRALDEAASVEVVSFDIFDTALTRLVDSPVDVFAEVERRLVHEFGFAAKGFATAREQAERDTRTKYYNARGVDEVSYDAIYAELAFHLPALADHLARAARLEMEVESALLIAVPDILELSRRLRCAGKRFIFVSDMYLPRSFLENVLRGVGYNGWETLYVSSETLATKSSGKQWAVINERYPHLDRILHIGDDIWSDGVNATNHGVKTLVYERARSERRVGAPLTPHLLPFSYAQRNAVLHSRATLLKEGKSDEKWHSLGKILGGIVLAGFVRWLEQRVRVHNIDKLYFCARDGWLIQRAWKAAGMDRKTGIEDHYLCVSRRPLNLAGGYIDSTPNWLPQTLIDFLCSSDGHRTTLRIALHRANLNGEPDLEADLIAHYGSLEAVLTYPDGINAFGAVLRKHSSVVHKRLKDIHSSLIGYLKQEKIGFNSRSAIVDLGWHASLQRSLSTLLEKELGDVSLSGFYYGLWPAALGNRYKAGPMEAPFANEFIPIEQQPEIHFAVDIVEELHMAPHGSTISYEQRDGTWHPIFADSPLEVKQYDKISKHFQDGALETVAELFSTGHSGSLVLDTITPDVVRSAMAAVFLSPSIEEVSLFGQLGHCPTFDHSHFDRLIPESCPDSEEKIRSASLKGSWRIGTLRAWYDTAPNEHRTKLRNVAKETLAFLGERRLRQFD